MVQYFLPNPGFFMPYRPAYLSTFNIVQFSHQNLTLLLKKSCLIVNTLIFIIFSRCQILFKLYGDLLHAFETADQPVTLFHMGGDEVIFHCWATNPEIIGWMEKNNYPTDPETSKEGYLKLWGLFQEKAKARLESSKAQFKPDLIMWTSELAKPGVIEK